MYKVERVNERICEWSVRLGGGGDVHGNLHGDIRDVLPHPDVV